MSGFGTGVVLGQPLRRVLLRGINGHAAGVKGYRGWMVAELPASWPLLPRRDGRGFAGVFWDCRSLFALFGEGRRGNFNVGGMRAGEWRAGNGEGEEMR